MHLENSCSILEILSSVSSDLDDFRITEARG